MNQKNISFLFDRYIKRFELVNNEEHNENSKWEAVNKFQKVFDLEASDFAEMLSRACEATDNLVDDCLQPFHGLVRMANQDGESEKIRNMFKKLYSADGGDLDVKQAKIDEFIRESEALINIHYPGSHLYKNDQRTVMAYLWFYDPEHNYMVKNAEAKYFAKAVEFTEDWGGMADFRLDVFYEFCDRMVEELKKSEEILKLRTDLAEGREDRNQDVNLHILLYDLIYSAYQYDLYDGMKIRKYSMDDRKKFRQNKKKGDEVLAELAKIEEQRIMVDEAIEKAVEMLETGADISHKMFGKGKAVSFDREHIVMEFPNKDITKKFQITSAIGGGFLKVEVDDFQDYIEKYAYVLNHATSIQNRFMSLNKSITQYEDFVY